ncbi:MAG: hypothetical protein HYY22_04260 [Thaumarchaeota archaeon]|nr:hypothetical protein [Nitrososphaerota archaeon]
MLSKKEATRIVGNLGNDEAYLLTVRSWLSQVETPLRKGMTAVDILRRYPIVMRLFLSSLPNSSRNHFRKGYNEKIESGHEQFWLYDDFDGVIASHSGTYERSLLVNMLFRASYIAALFKRISDRLLSFDLSTPERVLGALALDTRAHPFDATNTA